MKRLDPAQVDRLRQQFDSLLEELQDNAMRLAAVQAALLPKNLPVLPGFQAAVFHQPRQVVGGDWYGVVPFPYPNERAPRHVAIAIGDVCGHDVSATVVMAIVLAILRCYRATPASPADVMRHLNARLCEMGLPNGLTSAFIGFLSLDDLKLIYCTAGHPRPLVRDPGGVVRLLVQAAGPLLGAFEEATWQDAEEILPPGSVLCLYTDGITDTAAAAGTLFGRHRLSTRLSARRSEPQVIVNDIIDSLGRHQKDCPQKDDRTLLVARIGADEHSSAEAAMEP